MRKRRKERKLTPHSRLSMLDEDGWRKRIIPAAVQGRFRKWRSLVYSLLLLIFLASPWVTINGSQLILLDIPNRRFEIFGALFLAHDSPLLFFIFAIFIISIMLATALWGRVWCGWACPQTVFIDTVYRRIETFIEGSYLQQRALHKSPMSLEKFSKYSAKWFLFFILSSLFAHSFTAYFVGSKRLMQMMHGSPSENWTYFVMITFMTILLLFNFGWFREQFCIIMCPYGKFQSVLLDSYSLNVTYNGARGEPRKAPGDDAAKRGDCVSCHRCVEVCPTGIDIRNGIQLECIGCTACIDACDEIMTKVKKPIGLISYASMKMTRSRHYWRPRIVMYVALLMLFTTAFTYTLSNRQAFTAMLLRATDAPFERGANGSITNHFKISLHNQNHKAQTFTFSLGNTELNNKMRLIQSTELHTLQPGDSEEVHIFVSLDAAVFAQSDTVPLQIKVTETESGLVEVISASAVGPSLKN